ncbi:purine nucleoside phosphorylase, partial [Clonorchis sinensis]
AGHDGNLVFGMIAEKAVVIMQGRFHHYEGFSAEQIVLPIRVLELLGVETLLISNAAGGLSKNLEVGDFVILTDHISLAGLTTDNVLVGPNDEHFGPRFPDIADAYCPQLRRLMQAVAGDLGLGDRVHTGVYFHTIGPSYGTKAENRMLIQLGGNVVGMSTVPEVVVARHCGMRVFAISVVTSMCNPDLQISEPTTHEDVLDAAKSSAKDLMRLFLELIRRM